MLIYSQDESQNIYSYRRLPWLTKTYKNSKTACKTIVEIYQNKQLTNPIWHIPDLINKIADALETWSYF
jgi:hypothetical protein